ncbi:hypothetical protein C8Q75DRAFT_255097 [Abortiporus biennis]|nr:hypothetical protein C8Q75DRAFT_255097 [Abortiporus biennis]
MLTRASARKRQVTQIEDSDNETTSTVAASDQLRVTKKRKVQESNPDTTEKKPVARVRRKGVLKEMLEMPLDILFEIFGELQPQDLLALSRTTKDFHNLLISKSSIRFWKAAFENAPELPAAFPGMNELAFANLLFSNHCHNCFKANVRNVFWVLRARFCNNCKKKRLLKIDLNMKIKHLGFLKKGSQGVCEFLPVLIDQDQYFVDVKWIEELKKLWKGPLLRSSNGKAVQHILDERRNFVESNREAAFVCSDWYSKKLGERVIELDQLRADRLSAILDRLRALGYGVEIDRYTEETEKALRQEKIVREPKLLTDRTWLNFRPGAVRIMDEIRTWRIDKEYKEALQSRMSMVINSLTRLRGRVYGDINFPSPIDFLNIPRIRSIIEVPAEVTLTLEGFLDEINPILPQILEDWQKSVDARLVRSIISKCNIPNGVDPLSIAVGQFFFCESCRRPCIYPNVRSHSCPIYGANRKDTKDLYESVLRVVCDERHATLRFNAPSIFSMPRRLILGNIISMASIVEKVITTLGYITGQTTLKEMESVDALMICKTCEDDKPVYRRVIDWKTMILHGIKVHWNEESFSPRLATDIEVEIISKLAYIPRYTSFRNRYKDGDFMCAHCDDLDDFVTRYKIASHLSKKHRISKLDHEIEECDVIESSDTFTTFRTELPIDNWDHRKLMSDQPPVGENASQYFYHIESVLERGYGAVCNFDELDKYAAASRRVPSEATDNVGLSENVEVN